MKKHQPANRYYKRKHIGRKARELRAKLSAGRGLEAVPPGLYPLRMTGISIKETNGRTKVIIKASVFVVNKDVPVICPIHL